MILFHNRLGSVTLTAHYFSELVAGVAQDCFGVAGMVAGSRVDSLKGLVMPGLSEKGVRVAEKDGKLYISLHIKVTYGLNIAATVQSITHKVKYAVEEATGLDVKRVDVCVDDVIA